MFARAPFVALLACPRCRGALDAGANEGLEALRCAPCGATFGVVRGVARLRGDCDPRTDSVRAFYSVAPFPNYPPDDTLSRLRARGDASELGRLLDGAIAPDARVLEIGCGTGQMSLYLATGDRAVVAADLTLASLELGADAARRYGVDGVRFVETDLHAPGLAEGAFDVVYTSGVLHHTPDPRAAFAAIVPLVRPGGFVVVGLYNAYARVPHRLRRALAKLVGLRLVPFDPVLRERDAEPARRAAWLRDQYLHPEEHRHTIAEVEEWFEDSGVDYVRSYPNTNIGAAELRGDHLFSPAEDDWGLENVAAQIGWMFTLGREGGLWVMVGRRRETGPTDAAPRAPRAPPDRRARRIVEAGVVIGAIACAAASWLIDRWWWEEHVLPLHCAVRPWEVEAPRVVRVLGLVVAAALLLVVRPLLGAWVGRDARQALGAVLRIGVAALLALVSTEAILRVTHPPAAPLSDVPAIVADPHLGRALAASRTSETQRGGRTVAFAVNALGLRARSEGDLPDLSRPSILVAGESIAQGYAVNYDESAPYLVEQSTGVPTLNAGVSAYANDQVYRRMREVLDRLERPLAVVTFVVPLQIRRDVDYRRERLAPREDGSLAIVPPASPRVQSLRLFDLFDHVGPHSGEAFEVARAVISATAKDVRQRGAFPLFLATNFGEPCLHDESGESSLAHHLFAGLNVEHVSVDLDPAWSVPGDGHPDVRGSRALADAIVRELRKAQVL
jgi:SAM-dependent methyltransferase